MKIAKRGLMKHQLDFFFSPVPCPGGGQRYVALAFGSDGTMWINPTELGIGPQHAAQLSRFPGPYLLFDEKEMRVFINALAVVEVKTDPEWRKQWLSFVDDMLKEHQQIRAQARAQYESARNN